MDERRYSKSTFPHSSTPFTDPEYDEPERITSYNPGTPILPSLDCRNNRCRLMTYHYGYWQLRHGRGPVAVAPKAPRICEIENTPPTSS